MSAFGLLWFDDNPDHTLDEKVLAACARHAQKFGVEANTVYVHPAALETVTMISNGVRVVTDKGTLPHCFFVVREPDD